jgi:isoamylase
VARLKHNPVFLSFSHTDISWLNWEMEVKGKHLIEFVRHLTSLRHKFPILRRGRFYTGAYDEALQVKDLTWINANGAEMEDEHWGDSGMKCFGMLMDGRAQSTGIQKRGGETTMLLVINGHSDLVEFTLPACNGSNTWNLVIDTNLEENNATGSFASGDVYGVTGRSLLLFALENQNHGLGA